MSYKVGEKVRVRKDLVDFHNYSGITMRHGMQEFAGKECVIVDVVRGMRGTAAELSCGYFWSAEMLEPVYEIGDKVRVIGVKDGYSNNEAAQTVGSVGTVTEFPHKSFSHDFDVVEIDFVGHQTHVPVSCIEKVSDVEEEKNCLTCTFEKLGTNEMPCSKCKRGAGFEEKWEPKDNIGVIPSFYSSIPLFNVVFVTHDDDYVKMPFGLKQYLFGVPHDVTIKKGDKLFADTRKGRKIVTAFTNSFKTDKAGLDALDIMNGCHKGELKSITGYAQKQEEWKEVPFK